MPIELATAYITLLPSAKGVTAGIEKELGAPLAAAGRTSGAKSSAAFGTAFKSGLKTAAVGVGIVAGVAAIGKSFDDAFNTIARGTGETGAVLESLDTSFKNVLKGSAGSFEQVSAAITTLHQRTGLTGAALEDFAKKEVALARITKTDVNTNLQSTTALFNLFGIAATNQSSKLDVLFKASQLAGVSVSQLASDMQAAAPTAKTLGLTIDQTAALVAGLDKVGLPASRVMLGLASTFAKAAKSGREPIAVIKELVKQVKAAPTATDAATLAVKRFGISARAASVLVAGIRSGAVDLTKSLDGGKGILATAAATATLSGKLANLKNVALVGLEPLATQALGALTRGVTLAIPLVTALANHMDVLGPIIVGVTGAFVAFKVAVGISQIVNAAALGVGRLGLALRGEAIAATEAAGASGAAQARFAALIPVLAAVGAGFALGTAAGHKINDILGGSTPGVDALSSSFEGLAATQKLGGAASKHFGGDLHKLAEELHTVQGSALEKGFGFASSAHRAVQDIKSVNDALKDVLKTQGVKTSFAAFTQIRDRLTALGVPIETINKEFNPFLKAVGDTLPKAAATAAGAEKGLGGAATAAAVQQDQLRLASTNLTTALSNNADRLRGLQEGLVGVLQSAINLRQGVADVADKQKAYNDAVAQFGPKSKEAIKAGQDLELTQLGQIGNSARAVDGVIAQASAQSHLTDHLKAQAEAQAALTKAQQDGDPTKLAAAQDNLDRATKAVADSQGIARDAIIKLAQKFDDPAKKNLLDYANSYKLVPDKKVTPVSTPGLVTASKGVRSYKDGLDKIPLSKGTKITVDASGAIATLSDLRNRIAQLQSNVPLSAIIRAEGGRVPATPQGAHGLVASQPMLALIGENAATTPEVVSPVALMARTFREELARTKPAGDRAPVVFTGSIQAWDDRDLARRLDERMRQAEILAGV